MTGNEIREAMIAAREEYIGIIRSELLGPGSEFSVPDAEHEIISTSPTSRYSVGILFPQGNLVNQDNDETVPVEENSSGGEAVDEIIAVEPVTDEPAPIPKVHSYSTDETAEENLDEEISMSTQYMPSSMGITFLVRGNCDIVHGKLNFATYRHALVPDCMIPYCPEENSDTYVPPSDLMNLVDYDAVTKTLKLKRAVKIKEVHEIFERDTIPENEAFLLKQIMYRFVDYCSTGYVREPHEVADFVLDFSDSDYIDNESTQNRKEPKPKLLL